MPKKKEYFVKKPPAGPPIHPGVILREDVLPALRVSISQAAEELGVSRQTLHRILAETHPVTPEMAVRLGKWCGNGPDLWLRLQQAVDIARATDALRNELGKIRPRQAA